MTFENWLQVISGGLFIVVSIVSLIFGLKWKLAKDLLKQVAEALTATSAALEDDDVTHSERQALLREWGEAITAARSLIGK